MPNLQEIGLYNENISDKGLATLLDTANKLDALTLVDCHRVTDKSMSKLKEHTGLATASGAKLIQLTPGGCAITNKSMHTLETMSGLKRLGVANLKGIGPDQEQALRMALPHTIFIKPAPSWIHELPL